MARCRADTSKTRPAGIFGGSLYLDHCVPAAFCPIEHAPPPSPSRGMVGSAGKQEVRAMGGESGTTAASRESAFHGPRNGRSLANPAVAMVTKEPWSSLAHNQR